MSRRSNAVVVVVSVALLTLASTPVAWGASARPRAATTVAAPSGLPLYEFTNSGTGPLPWTATGLASVDDAVTMSAGPETATGPNGNDIVAFSTGTHDVAILSTGSSSSFTDLTTQYGLPAAATAPIPFFDSLGRLNLAYTTSSGEVVLATGDADPGLVGLGHATQFQRANWIVTNVSASSATTADPTGLVASGSVSAESDGDDDLVAVRTSNNTVDLLTIKTLRPFSVISTTALGTSSSAPTFTGPVHNGVVTVALTSSGGHVMFADGSVASGFTSSDLSVAENSADVSPSLTATGNSTTLWIATTSAANGSVQLFTGTWSPTNAVTWTHANLTTLTENNATPGPALSGQLAMTVVGTQVHIAGQASGWGDLFDYSSTGSNGAWVATDVSATGGTSAKTVGSQVAAIDPSGSVTLFAGGVNSPAPTGVGIYDIPSSDLPHAVSDGWPILADTGGLGTQSAPWSNVYSASTISTSPDFLLGKTIQNSHKRETWLSFWTVSGPIAGALDTPAVFQSQAEQAGAAIATSIDSYVTNGLGLKPDWVILDPEGYPDDHSQLDGFDIHALHGNGSTVTVTTASETTLATGDVVSLSQTGVASLNVSNAVITVTSPTTFTIASTVNVNLSATTGNDLGLVIDGSILTADWAALITGWRAGLASVDTTLNAGLYADEYQYSDFGIGATSMPVFMAIAWSPSGNSPVPISHTSNVLGFIEFGNVCDASKSTQLAMFASPPWNGRYNTVQFNGYCTP